MFEWITGSRITNVIEDLQADPVYEPTIVEPPDTPAHQFAMKAFKQALFGTPAPEQANAIKRSEKKAKTGAVKLDAPTMAAPKENVPQESPSKQRGGIMKTPQTANKKKNVSFGSQVVDNEGKRGNVGRSGIPNNCPGKFPSPWTPGTELKLDAGSDKPRTRLTAAFLEARTTPQSKDNQKSKARDDTDITMDMSAPRSESGRYWKAEYEAYAAKSEKEVKKLVSKQQIAKAYAKKKDDEVNELINKLAEERRRFQQRERDLEQQNKDFQERLRQAMADNGSTSIEIATLKARIATLEGSAASTQVGKMSFSIYEDSSKDVSQLQPTRATASRPLTGKENSPPKPRHNRRQTMPEASPRRLTDLGATTSRFGTHPEQASILLGKSPRAPAELPAKLSATSQAAELSARPPLSPRKLDASRQENIAPKSPFNELPSSPLPLGSPTQPPLSDPWLLPVESSPHYDRMAFPISTGPSQSGPARSTKPRPLQRKTKSVSQASRSVASGRSAHDPTPTQNPVDASKSTNATEKPSSLDKSFADPRTAESSSYKPASRELNGNVSTLADPKFDVAKSAIHHADSARGVPKGKDKIMDTDRKAQAKKRLEEKRMKKKLIGS
ncbi:hypothetical protein BS50DRAFT_570893 [Corynespora cassiicola Philippines]|uniref:Spindle pole body-associated protein cut12 domain-containing protein n=1 Tax=Corynespora cassiicola Philippines TaxID=1448308 RepID=A0A2T2P231_CORCC|nr:hypothetical protein BS50DRAFT_570893 [Corynespora cassiicola Philippines]